jgi:hypothetical protein
MCVYSVGGNGEAVESDWVWWGNQQERNNLEDLSFDNSIKMDHEYIYCEAVAGLMWIRIWTIVGLL